MAEANSSVTYKDIPGFPGYRVGDDGTVWSCWKRVNCGRGMTGATTDTWRKLRPAIKRDGRIQCRLRVEAGKYRYVSLHRLVLQAFVGPCPDGMECCHNDGNPKNNHLTNLRWDTKKANHADQFRHGTALIGSRNPFTKLTDDQVYSMRRDYAAAKIPGKKKIPNGFLDAAAAKYNISTGAIRAICSRRARKYVV